MHGIGEKTAEKLNGIEILTIGDLAQANEIQIKSLLGINGLRLKERANGIDQDEVDPDSVYDFKSVGNSTTLPKDTSNQNELLSVIESLCEKVSSRLIRKKNTLGINYSVMIRYKTERRLQEVRKLKTLFSNKKNLSMR